jgi:hypothetical protein
MPSSTSGSQTQSVRTTQRAGVVSSIKKKLPDQYIEHRPSLLMSRICQNMTWPQAELNQLAFYYLGTCQKACRRLEFDTTPLLFFFRRLGLDTSIVVAPSLSNSLYANPRSSSCLISEQAALSVVPPLVLATWTALECAANHPL